MDERRQGGGRPAWLPDAWVIGVAGMISGGAAVDAAVWGLLPVAVGVGFGVGVPIAVGVIRVASLLAGARQAMLNLLTNSGAYIAGWAFVLEVLRASETITGVTAVILGTSLLYAGTAAMLLRFDGDELRGRRMTTRSARERFRDRPSLWIIVWSSVVATFVALAGIPFGGENGVLLAAAGGGIVLTVGMIFFGIRDVAAGGDGHWP